ncbi:MAG TPA: ABC-type transport auxiliary lipoprotein family protein [Burkholderiales bacterium]|nr:ABC-type transport auxiliary lipoprotein family protein [Burkholderiales bacterium]
MRRTRLLFAAAALLVACTPLKLPQAESQRTFLLDAQPPAAQQPARHDLALAVGETRAWPGFDGAAMAYTRRANEIEYFARNRWAEPPARMISPLVAQALERSGVFRAVVRARGQAAAELRLDTELMRLLQDFRAQPSRVELALHAQLVDLRNGRVLAAQDFALSENAPSDDPYGGVVAANRALARLLGELTAFCAAHAPAR